ncbi:MAG: hypothetical protein FWD41_05540 [Actinomycetia bacterium]|nr:hypothetical protein [Actinomycetes bacterium]
MSQRSADSPGSTDPTIEELWVARLDQFYADMPAADVVQVDEDVEEQPVIEPIGPIVVTEQVDEQPGALDAEAPETLRPKTTRRKLWFRIFAAALALCVFALFTTPSIVNFYRDTVNRNRAQAQQSYYELTALSILRMEEAASKMEIQDWSDESQDLITEAYVEGIDAMHALYVSRLKKARGQDAIEFEIFQYETSRSELSQEYIRIYRNWYETVGPKTLTS